MHRSTFLLSIGLALVLLTGCEKGSPDGSGGSSEGKIKVAFITNGPADFWKYAEAGCRKAERDFGVEVEYMIPSGADSADQQRLLNVCLNRSTIRGVAVSPLDPRNQTDILNEVAASKPVICHDSDAPDSNRSFYLGTNNYLAGREAGRLVKEALPDGGTIMIFVGKMDVLNAIERRQGLLDELAGNPVPDEIVPEKDYSGKREIGAWTILDTRTDQANETDAKRNAADALTRHPDLDCMVGLWGYNPPACLSAVQDAGLVGKVKIIGFDEYDATLQGILDGAIYAAVIQQPFEFGYQSVKYLKALIDGDKSVIPESGVLDIPHQVVRKDNAQAIWDNLKKLRASAEG